MCERLFRFRACALRLATLVLLRCLARGSSANRVEIAISFLTRIVTVSMWLGSRHRRHFVLPRGTITLSSDGMEQIHILLITSTGRPSDLLVRIGGARPSTWQSLSALGGHPSLDF